MLRSVATFGWGLLTLIGIGMVIGSAASLIGGHDDPSFAGKGRLHDPFIEEVKCNRRPEICDRLPSVKLDLPNGRTEDVSQGSLHDLVEREGPVAVDVEWVKDLESATRVRFQGRWYRAAYPADADVFGTVIALVLGLGIAFVAGTRFLNRVLPDPDPETASAATNG